MMGCQLSYYGILTEVIYRNEDTAILTSCLHNFWQAHHVPTTAGRGQSQYSDKVYNLVDVVIPAIMYAQEHKGIHNKFVAGYRRQQCP